MTPLARTYPEPAGDIAAQMAALVDPLHPKRALWVSLGTPMVSAFDDLARVTTPVGWLYAAPRLLRWFKAAPSLETLASILDYVECLSPALAGFFQLPVVQALSPDGWVVQEQLVSWGRVGEARRRAAAYGGVRVVSVGGCLERRRWLIGKDKERVRAARAAVVVKRENKDRR
jgi:hypothetical protein